MMTLVLRRQVGYGDFYPTTFFGRIAVIVFIVYGVTFFGNEASKLVALVSSERGGNGSFKPRHARETETSNTSSSAAFKLYFSCNR